jgi:hypothetical protein
VKAVACRLCNSTGKGSRPKSNSRPDPGPGPNPERQRRSWRANRAIPRETAPGCIRIQIQIRTRPRDGSERRGVPSGRLRGKCRRPIRAQILMRFGARMAAKREVCHLGNSVGKYYPLHSDSDSDSDPDPDPEGSCELCRAICAAPRENALGLTQIRIRIRIPGRSGSEQSG